MDSSALLLTLLIALSAVVMIVAEQRGMRRGVYLFKPLTTILILVLAATASPAVPGGYRAMVCAGLLCSLAGDVFLMLPRDRFVAGLASFLVAHVFYVAAFAPEPARLGAPLALAAVLAYGAVLLRALWPRLGPLRAPVVLYAAALMAMAWQAMERLALLDTTAALLAAAGAVLFVASDSVLAWERFVRTRRWGPAVVLATYFPAQWLIALSVHPHPFG